MLKKKQAQLPVRQLVILSICRFAEPVVLTSVLPYLPEMIESVGVAKDEVAKWVGITSAVVAGCQCIMGVPWGTASDYVGRKPVILLGLTFTMIFSLMFGFSHTLTSLIVARAFQGLMNGNVGIIRTMVAEMVPEKELQPRAFSVMPLVWTIGSIFGPAFGGALANPAEKHPKIFGNSEFLKKYPFALPNIASAILFVIGITTGFLFMKETLETRKDKPDYGLILGQALTSGCTRSCRRRRSSHPVKRLDDDETTALLAGDEDLDEEDFYQETQARQPTTPRKKQSNSKAKRPSWGQVLTPQSILVLIAYSMLAMHSMAFDSLFPVFLHYHPQNLEGNPDVKLPFKFAGGFGVDSQTIGILYTLIGVIGMFVQFLIFPATAKRYGVLNCLKATSIVFPILHIVTPFIVLLTDPIRSFAVFLLMLFKLFCVIFSFPCCTILLTNSASSLSILGTLNGVGTSVSAIGRASGPALVGATFSFGVEKGYMIIPWWILALVGALSAIPVFWIQETDGFMANKEDDEEDEFSDDEAYEDRGPRRGR
ncbi:MFS transporter, putative [Paecilomyces variotii No. 5]|uniref:MFS transporter, putative n=1 Tax=Byssochlamys spectabilis (strain No. 5 / NBRC 109023) TaxID=1356009 RepID=V5FYJ6_BYSSN|nr:MFS transporter, putative [Paecilomyces variotii No. 5]